MTARPGPIEAQHEDAALAATATRSMRELVAETGSTRRTVHYYIAQGLLPPGIGDGRSTRYGQAHVDRLRLIRELQREHLPLAEIRQRLEVLGDRQVADLLRTNRPIKDPPGSAYDYIQSVLSGANRRTAGSPPSTPPTASAAVHSQSALAASVAPPLRVAASSPAPPAAPQRATGHAAVAEAGATFSSDPAIARKAATEPPAAARSQWERISLGPDVELHLRRPLSRIQNRAVDRLVGLARQLLEEERS